MMPRLPPVEVVAAAVHRAWMRAKAAQGVTSRVSESGEELMVEYARLSEPAKNLDRSSVLAVYEAIEAEWAGEGLRQTHAHIAQLAQEHV